MPENETVRKSDNQGVKEIFIQTDNVTMQKRWLPHPGKYLKLRPLQCNRCSETKKYGPNERTDQNSRKIPKQGGHNQPIRYRLQNIGNNDTHRND